MGEQWGDNQVQAVNPRIGVFLCECGGKISSRVDLSTMQRMVKQNPGVAHAETLPFPCLNPGLARIKEAVVERRLNRVIVAGCEHRIMLKKFLAHLEEVGLQKGEIDMVNIRNYVAFVGNGDGRRLADKGAKLIDAAAAGLHALIPSPKSRIDFKAPVMIVGGGIATYSAAQELLRQGIETTIAIHTEEIEDEIRMLHERYPGERGYHERLTRLMKEVEESPLVKRITSGELDRVTGVVGDFTLTFTSGKSKLPTIYRAGSIIAALDGEMLNLGAEFGHDGKRVVCHTEMEEFLWVHGVPDHRVLFWINDMETDRAYSHLSAKTAWNMARYIREKNVLSQVSILFDDRMKAPLSVTERAGARELEIQWIPYDGAIRPTIQNGFITYYEPDSHMERELAWDRLVLSPKRNPGLEQIKLAEILGFHVREGEFLERNPQMVRPEQVGLDERFLAGSARKPCDLREALRQGRRAARKTAEIVMKAREGKLFAPRMVCSVDPKKCTGCGLCKDICDCGGISPGEAMSYGVPRVVDPMVCTGGGTCAAACPYQALVLKHNTTLQREERVAALASRLTGSEVMGIGCSWGGAAAADNAGLRGLKHDERFYLLPIDCIGQLDPTVMGRAFLEGANGLLLIGCPPEECHHSYGIDHAWSRVMAMKKLLAIVGLERERIALAHADLNKPEEYVRTVNLFVADMERLRPIDRNDQMTTKLRDLYETLKNPRVRWVLGTGLRRPWETRYPADQRYGLAYDETLSDVLLEEFLRIRITKLLKQWGAILDLAGITRVLGEEKEKVQVCLAEMAKEGIITQLYKDRVPFYTMQ
ncbi:MAG: hydrogenase iron-sulfur subunit [Desulfobacteraceae bacterium]|nr:MAG: hydrogenase iron-sulfur subunit [Desulfobacteraceae bacterium]